MVPLPQEDTKYDAGMPLAYASMIELLQQAVDHSFT
jgi:hypothetical protein